MILCDPDTTQRVLKLAREVTLEPLSAPSASDIVRARAGVSPSRHVTWPQRCWQPPGCIVRHVTLNNSGAAGPSGLSWLGWPGDSPVSTVSAARLKRIQWWKSPRADIRRGLPCLVNCVLINVSIIIVVPVILRSCIRWLWTGHGWRKECRLFPRS